MNNESFEAASTGRKPEEVSDRRVRKWDRARLVQRSTSQSGSECDGSEVHQGLGLRLLWEWVKRRASETTSSGEVDVEGAVRATLSHSSRDKVLSTQGSL